MPRFGAARFVEGTSAWFMSVSQHKHTPKPLFD
jgi:hypothetical protein